MRQKEYRQFKAAKFAFIAMMGIGYLLRPELVKENKGVSNFWFKKRSKLPYIAGFAINSLVTIWVARNVWKSSKGKNKMAKPLAIKAVLALVVLLSSPLLRTKKSRLHYLAGGAMYIAQMLISIKLIAGRLSLRNLELLAAETVGTLLNLITATGKIQQMFTGQILAQAGYIGLLLNILNPGRARDRQSE